MSVSGYSLSSYGRMIKCEPRMSAYARALEVAVESGSHVIDLGAGPGLFSLLACKMGARHVTAIEPDASIEIARRAAADNGFADRITFIRDLSTKFSPEEKADVIVSDIRGVLPLFENHIPAIRDARARLLKPGGRLIPAADHIYAALVEAPALYAEHRKPWLENDYGVDLSACYGHAINSWRRTYQGTEALLSQPQIFVSLDYNEVEETTHRASLSLEAQRSGTVHGILLWFETELAPGIGYSNAPGEPEQVYGQGFFPLEHAVSLEKGSIAEVDIAANFINGDYIWNWSFRARDADGVAHSLRQSTFKSTVLSRDELAPRSQNFRPPLRTEQAVDIFCLGLFTGEQTLAEISREIWERFPGEFPDEASAFDHVASLSARYNRGKLD